MKIGDKLICKKPLKMKLGVTSDNYDKIKKGNYYSITNIQEHFLYVKCEIFNEPFNFTKHDTFGYYLYDYFYTTIEERKLKLDKLNESNL